MAVAIGAGCDFLTPIGHQCNTLVMGPGAISSATIQAWTAPVDHHRTRDCTCTDVLLAFTIARPLENEPSRDFPQRFSRLGQQHLHGKPKLHQPDFQALQAGFQAF